MPETNNHRANAAMWLGAALLLTAVLSNVVYFVSQMPGQQVLPWINLLVAAAAVAVCITALRRSQKQEELRRSKAAGWTLSILSSLLLAFSFLMFFGARKLPSGAEAPQAGQKAPDFTLRDTQGTSVTLAQLLSSPIPGTTEPPKAVLLIFYRGYW